MELRDLRALLAVIRTGSFTAAGAELGYTQSAISQQIGALESEVGQPLLERRPVRPTAAGRRLAEHGARILLRLDVARSELAHLGAEPAPLRIAVSPLAAPGLVATALRQLRADDALRHVTVRSLDAPSAVAGVAAGELDAAVVDGITAPDNPLDLADAGLLHSSALVEVPVVVALAADHPLRRARHLDLEALADAPWIQAPAMAGWAWAGAAPTGDVLYQGNDLPTLLSLVAAGLGCALLPAPAAQAAPGVAAVALRRPELVHRSEVLTLRRLRPDQQRLLEALVARAELV